ncbi:MAG TPA: hypothetical protein VFQ39_11475 [Longimicrobium sp.]|nr:hypothetical protein [Longimicrobium sp.]
MADSTSNARDHIEAARELVWEAFQKIEEAQRVLFRAGDSYVAEQWGDGVRSLLEVTERMADLSGDVSAVHIDIGKLARRDKGRDGQRSS